VLFRTAHGTKLYNATMGDRVAFEADDHAVAEGWSVIIKGRAHLLSSNADILEAAEAPLWSWPATLKPIYVRVIAMEITGRRFKFGPEPDRESTLALWLLRGIEIVTRHGEVIRQRPVSQDDCGGHGDVDRAFAAR